MPMPGSPTGVGAGMPSPNMQGMVAQQNGMPQVQIAQQSQPYLLPAPQYGQFQPMSAPLDHKAESCVSVSTQLDTASSVSSEPESPVSLSDALASRSPAQLDVLIQSTPVPKLARGLMLRGRDGASHLP